MPIRMGVSKDSLKAPEPIEEDLYTFRVEGFKPQFSQNKQSINYNPQLRVIVGSQTGTKNANKTLFNNLNSQAGWIQNDFCHSLGLEMETMSNGELTLPGGFNGNPDKPADWVYSGPIVGKEGQAYVVKQQSNKDPNKFFNVIKYFVCKIPDCNKKFPDLVHSKDLS